MQPRPIAETCSPLVPSVRLFTGVLLTGCGAWPRSVTAGRCGVARTRRPGRRRCGFFSADGESFSEGRSGTRCGVVAFGRSEAAHRVRGEGVDRLAGEVEALGER